MEAGTIRNNLKKRQVRIALVLTGCVLAVLLFFLLRSALWSRQDEQAELLRIVSLETPLESVYRPRLAQCRGVELEENCAQALEILLQSAEQAGCPLVIEEGYLSREQLRQRHEQQMQELLAQGMSEDEAELSLGVDLYSPGASEHELGLAVDLQPGGSDGTCCQDWLQQHSWEHGFVLRYPEGKLAWTGRDYQPWHYRYVGHEAAAQMQQLGLCLEEYYLWFYSDAASIVLND